ncbi:MAG: hypothetical protein Q8L01_01990 [Candidatus Woesebacteria bacterium]|nr:hypothetical protein [Candidatus Woesebacteria bacterium]
MKKVMLLIAVILMAFTGVSAQKNSNAMDSVTAYAVPGQNPQTEETIKVIPHGSFISDYCIVWCVRPGYTDTISSIPYQAMSGDTLSVPLTGLSQNTSYIYQATFIFSGKKSAMKIFTTASCPFVASISHSGNSSCLDTITASPTGSQYNYQWKINGINIPGATSQVCIAQISGNYSATVADGTCSSTSPALSVTITSLPIITSGPVSVCKGSSTELIASGGDDYKWSPTTGLSNPNIANPTASPIITTTYTVTVTATNGCFNSASIKVTVNINSTQTTLSSTEDSVCNETNKNVTLTGLPTGGEYSGSGVIGNIFVPKNVNVGPNKVSYTITDNNGCEAIASKNIFVFVPPVVDSMRMAGEIFVVQGSFSCNIKLGIGTRVYTTSIQTPTEAFFSNVSVKNGDWIFIQYLTGDCFTPKQFSYGLGMEELFKDQKNDDTRIFDVLGREIKNPIPNNLYIKGGKKFIYKE